jgi:pimeloyl-ACP methyl ester carboxylesterase
MPEIELTAGTIEYADTGGDGSIVVLLHGAMMNGSLWRHVVAELRAGHRCVVPELPLGGHRRPMRPGADLSFPGLVGIVVELIERLGLRDVTLAGNDSGLMQLVAVARPDLLARLVITSCEAFDNCPPGLPGRGLLAAARVPGGINALAQPMRLRPLRRLPMAFGWMAKRPIPHAITDDWLRPVLTQPAIRRDLRSWLRSADTGAFAAAAERLRAFERPTLVAWAAEDRVMPPEHGRRLAALLPDARHVEIPDSYTLIPEDQPAPLATAMREFVATT